MTISWAAIPWGQGSSAQIWIANVPGNPHDAAVRCRTVNEENGGSCAADSARRWLTTSVLTGEETSMDRSSRSLQARQHAIRPERGPGSPAPDATAAPPM